MIKKNNIKPEQQTKVYASGKFNFIVKYKIAISILFVIIILFTAGLIPRLLQKASLEKETHELAIPKVTVVSPTQGNMDTTFTLPAEIQPWIETSIYARATGYLKEWKVDIGAQVNEGQILAIIETPELDQEIEQAQHQLAEKESAFSLAKITIERYSELIKSSSVSEQDYAEKKADLEFKGATVSAARSNVKRLKNLKSFAYVKAPFSGTITLRKCDKGALISSGKELFRLSQTTKLRVYVHVPQAYADCIIPGNIAELRIPEIPNLLFPAKISRTAGEISSDSRTLLTQLEVSNSDSKIFAGSFGQVTFINKKNGFILMIPANSVMYGIEGPVIAKVDNDNKIQLQRILVGRNFGQMIEVFSGIDATDRIITNPSESFVNGMMVTVVNPVKNK